VIEAFFAFSTDDQILLLEKTMEAWAVLDDIEPVGLKVKASRYELDRRLTADSMSKGKWYLLVDLGTAPFGKFDIPALDGRCGLYGITPRTVADLPCRGDGGPGGICPEGCPKCDRLRQLSVTPIGVRICQKAVIQKWLVPPGGDYNKEHAEGVRLSGKRVAIVRDVFYKSLLDVRGKPKRMTVQ
jgi:hypothetical protein